MRPAGQLRWKVHPALPDVVAEYVDAPGQTCMVEIAIPEHDDVPAHLEPCGRSPVSWQIRYEFAPTVKGQQRLFACQEHRRSTPVLPDVLDLPGGLRLTKTERRVMPPAPA